MLNPSHRPGPGAPLTHSACLAAASTARAQASMGKRRTWVQVRRYDHGRPFVVCGQVIDLDATGEELFKVSTELGPYWVTPKNVRLCSGDGHCTCEAEHVEGESC